MFGVVSRRVISIAKHKAKRGAKPTQKVSRFFRNLFSFTPSQKKYFLIGGIILLILIVGLVVFVYWYGQNAFDRTWVKFAITGPERVVSGENLIYILKYKNDTKVVLNDAQLTFFWPATSLPESGEW